MSEIFKQDVARFNADCSHCNRTVRRGTRTLWVRPYCHPEHTYERASAKGGSVSIICVRCAEHLYGYDKKKGLASPTLSPQEEAPEGDS